jgi:hypothetical protein
VILLHNADAGDADHSSERISALIRQAGHTVASYPVERSVLEQDLATQA